jgi:hypothetical protein
MENRGCQLTKLPGARPKIEVAHQTAASSRSKHDTLVVLDAKRLAMSPQSGNNFAHI